MTAVAIGTKVASHPPWCQFAWEFIRAEAPCQERRSRIATHRHSPPADTRYLASYRTASWAFAICVKKALWSLPRASIHQIASTLRSDQHNNKVYVP